MPEHRGISNITHLLYPFNHVNPRIEIQKVVSIARELSLSISIVSVEPENNTNNSEVVEFVDFVKKQFHFEKIEIELMQGKDLLNGIESHVSSTQGALLTVIIHEKSPCIRCSQKIKHVLYYGTMSSHNVLSLHKDQIIPLKDEKLNKIN